MQQSINTVLPLLEKQIASTLNVQALRPGRHVIRDQNKWKTGEFLVQGTWLAMILPSFHPPAALAVLYEEGRIRGAFVILEDESDIEKISTTTSVEFAPNWMDPVPQILRQFNFFEFGGGLCLDGIEYRLSIKTFASQIDISFGNPQIQPFIELEQALYHVAQEIVSFSGKQMANDYLDIWRDYLQKTDRG